MSTTKAKTLPGKGTKLQSGDGASPEVFADIGSRVSISGPAIKQLTRNVTHLDSACIQKSSAIADPGTLTLKLYYDPNDTTHQLLQGRVLTGGEFNYKLVFNDGKVTPANVLLEAIVTGFNPTGMEVEGTLEADVEFELSDLPVFTPGADV